MPFYPPPNHPKLPLFKCHSVLEAISFDGDGNWFLDSIMYFVGDDKKLTRKEEEARKKRDALLQIVRKPGVFIVPYAEERRKTRPLFPQKILYEALGADKNFRFAPSGFLRLLEPPLPAWKGNLELRKSAGYQKLLDELKIVDLSPPPPLPNSND